MSKDNLITIAQEQLQKYEGRFIEMEKTEMTLRGELERKHIQLLELTGKIERNSPRKSDTHHNNLFL